MAMDYHYKKANLRNKLLLIGLVISIGFTLSTYFLIQKMHDNNAKQHHQSLSKIIPSMIEQEIDENALTLLSLIELIKNKPASREAIQDNDFSKLANILLSIYKDLSKHALISEIGIYDSQFNNVLSLSKAGMSTDKTKLTIPVSEFELIPKTALHTLHIDKSQHLVLAQVSPWFIDNSLVGYVVISQDLKTILNEISVNTNSTILALINKELTEKESWQKFNYHRSKSISWDELNDLVIVDVSSVTAVNQAEQLALATSALRSQQQYIKEAHGSQYISGQLPIFSANKQHLGEIIFINDATEFINESKRFSDSLLISIILLAIVFISFYTFFIHKIERQQSETLSKLQREVKQHRLTASDLLKAKEAAEEANKTKSVFLSSMSHEFRTPLNSIIGFTQLLSLNKTQFNEDDLQALDYIEKSGEHLLSLINDILDLAKIESGTTELNITDVNVANLFHTICNMMQNFANQHHISLQKHPLLTKELSFKSDQQKIQQILLNFVSNAIKYNVEGGSVLLNAYTTPENKVRLLVTDSGMGINELEIETIFQPFNRLDKAHSNIQGTGIGLSICKQLTELMGGTIGAYNNHDQGMTFWVEFDAV